MDCFLDAGVRQGLVIDDLNLPTVVRDKCYAPRFHHFGYRNPERLLVPRMNTVAVSGQHILLPLFGQKTFREDPVMVSGAEVSEIPSVGGIINLPAKVKVNLRVSRAANPIEDLNGNVNPLLWSHPPQADKPRFSFLERHFGEPSDNRRIKNA